MIQIVAEPDKLKRYQSQFIQELECTRPAIVPCNISWRPMSLSAQVKWIPSVEIWYFSTGLDNRWWNAFGLGQPSTNKNMRIACEINIPMYGINRCIAGGFAEDGDKVFVVHRGNKYGGGKLGITKDLFWRSYTGTAKDADDGGRTTKVAVVAELGDANLAADTANFTRWIARIKGVI